MIDVDAALQAALARAARRGTLPVEPVPLAQARGRILREAVVADRDMPPFARSAMDGYALRAADVASTPVTLAVIEQIPAGYTPRHVVGPGQAAKIMTGAPMPEGADAVQMVELTEDEGRQSVTILQAVSPGENVRHAGEDLQGGASLLQTGARLDASAMALLAMTGRSVVTVSRRARVAVIPTGDELVPVDEDPGDAKIRESNGHMIRALAEAAGADVELFPIVPDLIEELETAIGAALETADVVLLSGGVSMGDYDLVARALTRLGCRAAFDRVAIQPGKPLWFGGTGDPKGPLVFGLPGNPVSSLVDFIVFVRPALEALAGARATDRHLPARLAESVHRRKGRRGYFPARLDAANDALNVRLVPTKGSADMVAMSKADALVILSEHTEDFPAGSIVPVLSLDGLI